MERAKVETVLNQMKRGDLSQQSIVITAAGQILVPQVEQRVSLILCAHPTASYTVGLQTPGAVGQGIIIPALSAAVKLHLGNDGGIVKGPIYVVDGTFPMTITYMESVNYAP